jgi:lysozyme family protein
MFQPVPENDPKPAKKEFTVADIQKALNDHFDAKIEVDGKLGKETSGAIRRAEEFLKLPVDGDPDLALFEALEILEGLVFDFTPMVKADNHGNTKNPDFQYLWDTAVINPDKVKTVAAVCASINASQTRYEGVSKITGVPWQVIAVIHRMECSGRFDRHLHCGDPLTARTINVPKGRPVKGEPPFQWEESAIDALGYDGATGIKDWNIVATLAFLQKFNGTGYLNKGIYSPYLWSFSNHYTAGKFVKDGVYDASAVSQQCGAAVMLKVLGYEGKKLAG